MVAASPATTATAAYEWGVHVIHGHHIYKSIWSPVIGAKQIMTTILLKNNTIVGYVPFHDF